MVSRLPLVELSEARPVRNLRRNARGNSRSGFSSGSRSYR